MTWREAASGPLKAARYLNQSRLDLSGWFRHMWAGVKLLAADVRVSGRVMKKISHGKSITRRERNFIVQTGVDLARLVPFSLFLIIPAAEFALPFALRLFPNMLPSQFQSQMQKEENMTRRLKANIELAKYLRDVVENQARAIKSSHQDSDIKQEASRLAEFLEDIRSGKRVNISDVSRFAKLFNDELTIDGAVRPQLVAMCKFLGISAHGTDQLLRFRLRSRLNSIKSDDMSIAWEGGAHSLTDEEVTKACRDRGIRISGASKKHLRSQLKEWLEMSQDRDIPTSLMVLSRAFLYTGQVGAGEGTGEEGLKEALSSLPDDVVEDATMEAGGGDGSNIDRLEEAKRQSKLIEIEAEREARKEKDAEEKRLRLLAESESLLKEAVAVDGASTSDSISDAAAATAAAVNEAKIKAEHFTKESSGGDADAAKSGEGSDASPEFGAADEEKVSSDSPSAEDKESAVDERRDEDTIASERDSMKRFLDAFNALLSESAVDKEREELSELKTELAEAESVLASLGDNKKSELRRFKKMVTKLENQVESVDGKIGASMKLLDLDNDGVMSMEECVNAVKMLADNDSDAEIVTESLRRLDADADGNISRDDIQRVLDELQTEAAGMDSWENGGRESGSSTGSQSQTSS